MSILTYINKVPLYTSINEALEWGGYNGVQGYHIHKHTSVTGYMGGKNHGLIPLKTRDLPIKIKQKPGYRPTIGSTVITIANGKRCSTRVNADTIFDRTGAPLLCGSKKTVGGVQQLSQVSQTLHSTSSKPSSKPSVVAQGSEGASEGGKY